MSDPVKNAEIEDVLTSIRKLVADESRAVPPARKPERAKRPERLVLTPEQRVKDETTPPATRAEPVLLTEPLNTPGSGKVNDRPIETIPGDARLAEFGTVEGAFPDFDEVEEDIAPPERQDDTRRTELSRLIEEEVAAAFDATEAAMEDGEETGEDAAAHQTYTEDHDGAEDDNEADVAAVEFRHSHHAGEPAFDTHEPEPEPEHPPQTLEDKVAALGRLVARDASQEFEEERDRPDADDLARASEPMEWPDPAPYMEAEEETGAEASNVVNARDAWPPQKQPPQEPKSPETDLNAPLQDEPRQPSHDLPTESSDDDAPFEIDEQILRDLVGDIVRKELQGALGERITRNVRKLVRREIHRMLVSREFD